MTQRGWPIVVLISGRGSNLLSLLDHQGDFTVCGVVCDRASAPGLQHAKRFAVPVTVVEREAGESPELYRIRLSDAVAAFEPRTVCLAGFMQILRGPILDRFRGRIINIHPSLLPSFPGLNTHQRALDAESNEHGCTVHVVDHGVDTGPIIAQAPLRVSRNESAEELGTRVLEREHQLYPWVVGQLARGEISCNKDGLRLSPLARAEAQRLQFRVPG